MTPAARHNAIVEFIRAYPKAPGNHAHFERDAGRRFPGITANELRLGLLEYRSQQAEQHDIDTELHRMETEMIEFNLKEVVDFMLAIKGSTEERLTALGTRFPDMTREQFLRASGAARDILEQRAKASFDAAEGLEVLAKLRHGMADGADFNAHVKAKAEAGDALAIQYVNHITSAKYRTHSALFDAAIRAHPDWQTCEDDRSFKWIGDGPAPALIDEVALIDWYQTQFPGAAREIEDREAAA